jgi:ornithine carbamoyltransferase
MTMLVSESPRFLHMGDLDASRTAALLELAGVMKHHPLAWRDALAGRAIACLYGGPSTRSRVSIQVAVHRLGAFPVMLSPDEMQLGRGEAATDTARVLSAYCDAIVAHTVRHRDVLDLADFASIPTIDARACQTLADCLTLHLRFGDLHALPIAYIGRCDDVAHGLIEAAALTGMDLRVAAPPGGLADPALMFRAGRNVRIADDPRDAVAGALAVYTDGRSEQDDAFRVTSRLMELAAVDAVFMHPLPAHRGSEVETAVIDGPASVVWEQAANLLPVEQALLRALVTGDWEV